MNTTDRALYILAIMSASLLCIVWFIYYPTREKFSGISLSDITTAALDSAPSTSEVKKHYRTLLIYTESDLRAVGTSALRILGDLRNRLYGPRNFRGNLIVDDIFANWPPWLTPIDTTIKEPVPAVTEAIQAELKILAYIQKNYPQESNVDPAIGSIVTNIINDFGYRFVFDIHTEKVKLRDDFLSQPLTQNWVNPVTSSQNKDNN